VSDPVGLACKAGRRVECQAGVLKDKEGDMPLLLVVGLAVGTGAGQGGLNCPQVEIRLPAPSEWVLEWWESAGETYRQGGWLKLDWKGHGELFFGSDIHLGIMEYRLGSADRRPSIDLRLRHLMVMRRPDLTGLRVPGIYRLDGDRLFLCITDGSKTRPTGFTTQPNDGRITLVFRRKK
jgi:uncharacterized protein (TIGR03067 family)